MPFGIAITVTGAEAMDEKAKRWIESRGIDEELALRFGIESFQKNGKTWLKIPFLRAGECVNHKFRCIDEKSFYQEPDGKKCFWNQDIIFDKTLEEQPVIITEGEFDAIAAIQSGFIRTISVPDGAPAQIVTGDTAKYDYLDHAIAQLRKATAVIIAADGDQPGANLLHDLSLRIGRENCKWITYPKGCKDLNDALKLYGERGVVETINRAQWLKLDGVYKLSELPPLPDRAVYDIDTPGLNFKIRLADLTVVTGIPGHGKSTFVNDMCCRLARKHGLRTVFASFEQHPRQDHVRNLRKWFIGSNHKWSADEIRAADKWIEDRFSFIYPSETQADEETISLGWLLEKAAASVIRHGINLVVLDPWNEIEHVKARGETTTEYIAVALREIRKFARFYNVHVVVVAHPAKMRKLEDGCYDIPSLYDISDSANWNNKADLGIIIHQHKTGTVIRLAKSRYHDVLGKPEECQFMFNQVTNRFECSEI